MVCSGSIFKSGRSAVLRNLVSDLWHLVKSLPQLTDVRKLRVRGPYHSRSTTSQTGSTQEDQVLLTGCPDALRLLAGSLPPLRPPPGPWPNSRQLLCSVLRRHRRCSKVLKSRLGPFSVEKPQNPWWDRRDGFSGATSNVWRPYTLPHPWGRHHRGRQESVGLSKRNYTCRPFRTHRPLLTPAVYYFLEFLDPFPQTIRIGTPLKSSLTPPADKV